MMYDYYCITYEHDILKQASTYEDQSYLICIKQKHCKDFT